MTVSLIAALDRNRVIGSRSGGLPWRLPRDVEHFRRCTAGKPVAAGRRTFEEMRGWFGDRLPIVLTRNPDYVASDGGRIAPGIPEAIAVARASGADELWVCGGGEVFAAALPYADRLVLTLIDGEVEGDVFFPPYEDDPAWVQTSSVTFAADAEHAWPFRIVTLEREGGAERAGGDG
ncbi:MAG TPA: dihydrofolate reductase [Verrucomicrobiales bacterium]|nr:dihydrofolate reductase [Verrucomicrobiales bacterium]